MIENTIQQELEACNWEKALELLKTKDQNNLTNIEYSQFGWCYSRLENYNEAIKYFDILIAKEPNIAKWHYMKGYQYYMQQNWKEAVDNFEKALILFPEYLIVKYRLSYAYLQLAGNYLKFTKDTFWKALGSLNDCHKIYNNYSDQQKDKEKNTYFDICFLHGKTLIEMNNKKLEAIELLKKALTIKQDDNCSYQLSKAYLNNGELKNAELVLPKSNKYYIQELNAQILSEKEEYDNSNKILFKILDRRKKDYLYIKIADNFLKLKNNKQSLVYALQATRIGKDNYKNYFFVGTLYSLNKQYQDAIEFFKKAKTYKLKKFNLECPEADVEIDKILQITNGQPFNEKSNPLPEKVSQGRILNYNKNRGFGFLENMDKTKIFFHISNYKINELPKIGQEVQYKIKTNNDKIEAYDITLKN